VNVPKHYYMREPVNRQDLMRIEKLQAERHGRFSVSVRDGFSDLTTTKEIG